MKTLLLTFGLLLSTLSFSQKLVIEIFERQELISYRNTTLDSVLMSPDEVSELEVTKTTYVIDLDEKTSSYFVGGEFLSGLIVHIGYDGDNVLWYWNGYQMTTVKKMTKFNIVKSS